MSNINHFGAEIELMQDADQRAAQYINTVNERRVFPSDAALGELQQLISALPEQSSDPAQTLALLDRYGSPAAVTSNGPNYFGFVIGASLPVAAAAERLAAAWDQCASSFVNSPVAATVEKTAAGWLLEVLDLPRSAGVGFGSSATSCGLSCLAVARTDLLNKLDWDVEAHGLAGSPRIRLVLPESIHITVKKAARLLGFGLDHIVYAPVDEYGRVVPEQLPALDNQSILCLQAGEVNTGEFDLFEQVIPKAKAAGAWVHVDGAFGLWARASDRRKHLASGVDLADSWTTDGHKWLNTPYDSAVAICRNKALLAKTLNADAAYSSSEHDAQKNLTLEFSRRARGVAIWAALHSLGRAGVSDLVDQFCDHAAILADGCRNMGLKVLNRVVLNQVLCVHDEGDDATEQLIESVQSAGKVWFGSSIWQGRKAFRLSVSSWRTEIQHIERLTEEIKSHI